MPKAMHGMPKATFQALSLLNFVFIKDLNDLHKYLLVLPNSAYAPDLLILDDSLEAFVDNQLKVDTSYHATLYVKSKIRKIPIEFWIYLLSICRFKMIKGCYNK